MPIETVFNQLTINTSNNTNSPICIVAKGTVLPYNNTIATISDSNNPTDSVYFELLTDKDSKYVSLGFVNIPLQTIIAGIINIQIKIAITGVLDVVITNSKQQTISTLSIPVV